MKDIHPKGIHAGDQYGTTIMKSNPAIDFPKRQSVPGYGSRSKAIKPHGGDQYGTTIEKSKPYRSFPNAAVKLKSGQVENAGTALKVDSEKVITSQRSTMNIKGNQTGSLHSSSGTMPGTRYGKKGQMSDVTPKVF